MRNLAAFSFLVVAALVAGPLAAQKSDWITFRSDEGGFTIQLPGEPTRSEQPEANGGRLVLFQVLGPESAAGREAFFFGWADYPPSLNLDSQAELKANQDNLVTGVGGKLLTSKAITLGTATGLEFVAETPTHLLRGRVIMVGRRPYMYIAMVPSAGKDSPNIARYLDSFALISKK